MSDRRRPGMLTSIRQAVRGMATALPIILTVVLLLGLVRTYVPPARLRQVFAGHGVVDVLVGTVAGSISTGNPITSYIIGGELLAQGMSLAAVTSFLVAWVTVGIVQLPAEAEILGRRFAVVRNVTSIILAVLVSFATVWTVGLLP